MKEISYKDAAKVAALGSISSDGILKYKDISIEIGDVFVLPIRSVTPGLNETITCTIVEFDSISCKHNRAAMKVVAKTNFTYGEKFMNFSLDGKFDEAIFYSDIGEIHGFMGINNPMYINKIPRVSSIIDKGVSMSTLNLHLAYDDIAMSFIAKPNTLIFDTTMDTVKAYGFKIYLDDKNCLKVKSKYAEKKICGIPLTDGETYSIRLLHSDNTNNRNIIGMSTIEVYNGHKQRISVDWIGYITNDDGYFRTDIPVYILVTRPTEVEQFCPIMIGSLNKHDIDSAYSADPIPTWFTNKNGETYTVKLIPYTPFSYAIDGIKELYSSDDDMESVKLGLPKAYGYAIKSIEHADLEDFKFCTDFDEFDKNAKYIQSDNRIYEDGVITKYDGVTTGKIMPVINIAAFYEWESFEVVKVSNPNTIEVEMRNFIDYLDGTELELTYKFDKYSDLYNFNTYIKDMHIRTYGNLVCIDESTSVNHVDRVLCRFEDITENDNCLTIRILFSHRDGYAVVSGNYGIPVFCTYKYKKRPTDDTSSKYIHSKNLTEFKIYMLNKNAYNYASVDKPDTNDYFRAVISKEYDGNYLYHFLGSKYVGSHEHTFYNTKETFHRAQSYRGLCNAHIIEIPHTVALIDLHVTDSECSRNTIQHTIHMSYGSLTDSICKTTKDGVSMDGYSANGINAMVVTDKGIALFTYNIMGYYDIVDVIDIGFKHNQSITCRVVCKISEPVVVTNVPLPRITDSIILDDLIGYGFNVTPMSNKHIKLKKLTKDSLFMPKITVSEYGGNYYDIGSARIPLYLDTTSPSTMLADDVTYTLTKASSTDAYTSLVYIPESIIAKHGMLTYNEIVELLEKYKTDINTLFDFIDISDIVDLWEGDRVYEVDGKPVPYLCTSPDGLCVVTTDGSIEKCEDPNAVAYPVFVLRYTTSK